MDEVDHTVGDLLDLRDELEDQLARQRVALGGLEDERVAGRNRKRQEPERDHRREVEGGDRGDDADGLAHHLDVHAAGDAFERLPLEEVGDAAAASTDSIPRMTSPRASSIVLPMSAVTRAASSSWCSTRRSRSARTARARFCGGTARHAGCARRAAATAAATSLSPLSGMRAESAPVAGSMSSRVSPAEASTQLPPM